MAKIQQLSPSEIYEFVTDALSCRQVPYIAGPPGIGKSQIVQQVAKDANALVIDLRLSQILSEDMTGIPERNEETKKAQYLPFEMFPLEGDTVPAGFNGWILFLDELSSASEEVLAASYSLILDRTVGGKKLHPKCLVVAAGNRASDSAIARELPDTLITRMLPVEMTVNTNDWVKWAKSFEHSHEVVVNFITKNPTLLYSPVKAKDREELETYPTPRGWEKVFAHLHLHDRKSKKKQQPAVDSAGVPIAGATSDAGSPITEGIFNLMASAVGVMAARSLREDYDEAISLPYAWEVAQSPSSTRIPATNIGKAKLITQLSDFFITSNQDARNNLLTYVNRVGGEYSELFVKQIKDRLGQTQSDMRLISEIERRLSIDPILGGTVSGSF